MEVLASPPFLLRLAVVVLPLLGVLAWLVPRVFTTVLAARAQSYSRAGRTNEAVSCARTLLKRDIPLGMRWHFANVAIDIFVNAGLYSEALRVEDEWPRSLIEVARRKGRVDFAVARINRAEALANLGRTDDALATLDSVQEDAAKSTFANAGWWCLRAWVLIQVGKLEDARRALREVNSAAIGHLYAAEVLYTAAALERSAGNLQAAFEHANHGLDLAVRASSVRNGLFMVADIAGRLGDAGLAAAKFREAMDHPYKAQSADGLMRWAELLLRLGARDEAARIRGLAVLQDPESGLVRTKLAEAG
jgi:tetratricopeptide (TPR) repeat protein